MKTETIVFWVFVIFFSNIALIAWYPSRAYKFKKETTEINPSYETDEHSKCDCVGCASGCFECLPPQAYYTGQVEFNKTEVDAAKSMILPHNIVYAIIEMLQGTNKQLETVLSTLGFSSTSDLSLDQLLLIDDKLYRCSACGYWSAHVNASSAKYAALWKCPHCASDTV